MALVMGGPSRPTLPEPRSLPRPPTGPPRAIEGVTPTRRLGDAVAEKAAVGLGRSARSGRMGAPPKTDGRAVSWCGVGAAMSAAVGATSTASEKIDSFIVEIATAASSTTNALGGL